MKIFGRGLGKEIFGRRGGLEIGRLGNSRGTKMQLRDSRLIEIMTGVEFYDLLSEHYMQQGQPLFGNFSFENWLEKSKNSSSFQFRGKSQLKSIPKNWLIDTKDASNRKETIDRKWFNNQYNAKNFNDCRASVAIWLLENH